MNHKDMVVRGRVKGCRSGSRRQGGRVVGGQGGRVVGVGGGQGGRVGGRGGREAGGAGGGVNSMNERGTVPLSVLGPGASSQRAPRLRVRRRSAA